MAAPELSADVACRLSGDRLTITVPPMHIGSRLVLLWDDADKGGDPSAWANSHVVTPVVTEADSRYVVDLYSLGITNGHHCGIAVTDQYKMLDKLQMTSKQTYVNTGFKDTEVYGVRFGFYGNSGASSSGWNYIIGSAEGSDDSTRGFVVGQNNTSFGSWFWTYRGYRAGDRPSVRTDSINEAVFANRKFTLNGSTVRSNLAEGSVGTLDINICLGRIPGNADRFHYGWWSHVSFDDADGQRILDYIPVQRLGDNKVGFFDRATTNFVVSTGGGEFNAGTVTNELFSGKTVVQGIVRDQENEIGLVVRGTRLRISVPASFAGEQLLLVWDDSNKGDDVDAWVNSSVITDVIGSAGGVYDVSLLRLGVRDGQVCGVVTAHRLQLLDMLKMTSKQTYVDTGIKDSDCYGVRFGFYGNENSSDNNGKYSNLIGTYDSDNSPSSPKSGFTVGMNDVKFDAWYWNYRTEKPDNRFRPTVSTTSINDAAFTNRMFTLNGSVVKMGLEAGAVGESGANMHLGTWATRFRYLYGWWSFVRFDDASGNAILDYVPAKRATDGTVGFYDRATMKFVVSTGGGAFTAGTVTNSLTTAVHSRQIFSAAYSGLMVVVF